MIIPIPIGTRHTTILEGSAPRLVVCEQCGLEYVYTVERQVQGESIDLFFGNKAAAQARADQEAQRALHTELRHATDPVPCPACGRYQAGMVDRMRISYRRQMFDFGIALCVASPFLLLVALLASVAWLGVGGLGMVILLALLWLVSGGTGAVGVMLLILRSEGAHRYNPNGEDAEARKQLGRRLALPKEEYLKIIRELRKQRLI